MTNDQTHAAFIQRLEKIRRTHRAFRTDADTWTVDTWEKELLCIARAKDDEKILGIFNFSEHDRTAWINETDGMYENLLTGEQMKAQGVDIPAYGFFWLKRLPSE